MKNLMRSLTAWLEDDYCSITVVNHRLITVIRFVAKNYIHPWKGFANRLYLVLHAYEILFSENMRVRTLARSKHGPTHGPRDLLVSSEENNGKESFTQWLFAPIQEYKKMIVTLCSMSQTGEWAVGCVFLCACSCSSHLNPKAWRPASSKFNKAAGHQYKVLIEN